MFWISGALSNQLISRHEWTKSYSLGFHCLPNSSILGGGKRLVPYLWVRGFWLDSNSMPHIRVLQVTLDVSGLRDPRLCWSIINRLVTVVPQQRNRVKLNFLKDQSSGTWRTVRKTVKMGRRVNKELKYNLIAHWEGWNRMWSQGWHVTLCQRKHEEEQVLRPF